MNVNMVIVNSEALMKSIEATVTTDTLAAGVTALDKTGTLIEGKMVAGEGSVINYTAEEPVVISDNNVISVHTVNESEDLDNLTNEQLKYLVTANLLKDTVGTISDTLAQI